MQHLQCKEVVSFTLTFFSEVVILPEIFPEFLLGGVLHPPTPPRSRRPWAFADWEEGTKEVN